MCMYVYMYMYVHLPMNADRPYFHIQYVLLVCSALPAAADMLCGTAVHGRCLLRLQHDAALH